MPKISISLSDDGINNAIAALTQYKNKLDSKVNLFRQRISEYIASDASHYYSQSYLNIKEGLRGTPTQADVYVTVEDRDNMTVIIADGEDAVFVEFGAGVYANGAVGTSPSPWSISNALTIGSYGNGNGAKTTWAFRNEAGELELTHGTQATMPMYRATQLVLQDLEMIAGEVFGND